MIRTHKDTGAGVTPQVVIALASLTMRTPDGDPIIPAPHHLVWLKLMCNPAIRRLLIIGTPESAKTTWAIAYLACLIGFAPGRSGIIAAVSGSVAEKRSLALRNLIQSPAYRSVFPEIRPVVKMPWTSTEWSVADGGKQYPGRIHPTVSSYGTGGSIVGGRAYWLLGDDILDLDNTRTKHQRDAVDTWVHTSFLSRLMGRHGRVILIGNTFHHDDVYSRLRKSEGWVTCRMPLLSESEKVYATITYPDAFPGEMLGDPEESLGAPATQELVQ